VDFSARPHELLSTVATGSYYALVCDDGCVPSVFAFN
jgi:hypothetical protein